MGKWHGARPALVCLESTKFNVAASCVERTTPLIGQTNSARSSNTAGLSQSIFVNADISSHRYIISLSSRSKACTAFRPAFV